LAGGNYSTSLLLDKEESYRSTKVKGKRVNHKTGITAGTSSREAGEKGRRKTKKILSLREGGNRKTLENVRLAGSRWHAGSRLRPGPKKKPHSFSSIECWPSKSRSNRQHVTEKGSDLLPALTERKGTKKSAGFPPRRTCLQESGGTHVRSHGAWEKKEGNGT